MVGPAFLAQRRAWRINQDAIEFTFTRTTKERDLENGGFKPTDTPVTIRGSLVETNSLQPNESMEAGGPAVQDKGWALLTGIDQPKLNADPPNRDVFVYPGMGRFRVVAVREWTWHGETYGYTNYLERMA